MAKALVFTVEGREFSAEPVKVDRKKLYGWQETIALDSEGNKCSPAYATGFGTMVLPLGGIGSGILSQNGEWVERSSLVAVNADGQKMELLPSSFSAANPLTQTASEEEFLSHDITSVYQLNADKDFIEALGEKIWTFPYRYRDGYDSTAAFILESGGTVFMLLGVPSGIEMITLDQIAVLDDDDDEDDEDEIDFSFM